MKKELRYFQTDAINAIIEALKNKDSVPYINAVTGFGKSVVMADLTGRAMKRGKRVLQLVPNHTLCAQNYEQAYNYVDEKHAIGVCSAKIGKFQTNRKAVIATQTSFLRRRHSSGAFDVLIIDECDMVSTNENTTYQKIIAALLKINPKMRIVGLTGSPWRQDQGCIHEPVKDGKVIFTECCYESDIPRLINEGYLSSVKILNTHFSVNLDGVHIKNGDYDQQECGVKFNAIVVDAVADFKQLFAENGIKTALIFASTIENGLKIVAEYGNEKECKLAHGDLSTHERNELIKWLKDGQGTRCLVNVGLYTRGFDFPALEAIVLLRATSSLRLYVQIIGRLIRAHEEKECGFLADYGSNVERFGPIDNITPPKPPKKGGEMPKKRCLAALEEDVEFEGHYYYECEPCEYDNLLSAKKCKKCGAEFISENEEGKYIMRTKAQILQSKRESSMETYQIDGVYFEKTYSRASSAAMIKMLFYEKEHGELVHTHYLCLDHAGTARINAIKLVNNLLKNERDFYEISKIEGGCNVENMLMLLIDTDTYRQYFKTFDTITIMPEGRFKSLVKYTFKAE